MSMGDAQSIKTPELSATVPAAPQKDAEGPKKEESGSFGARIVSWVKGYNTYLPGISTFTAIGKVGVGLECAIQGVVRIGIGCIGTLSSVFLPKAQSSENTLKFSALQMGKGAYELATGIREVARGFFSAIPGVNLILLGFDYWAGLAGKEVVADPWLRAHRLDFEVDIREKPLNK